MRQFTRLRQLVLALSGVHTEALALVPSERARFESMGWAILITSGIATVSMWFALSSAIGINGILAIPVALAWGLVIMGIDRWLITSMPVDGSRKFAMAVPRVLLALLLGTLISTPLVLRVFQSEINAQMAVMQQKGYNSFLQEQQSSLVAKQVSTYKGEFQQLNTVINSHGASTGNTAADPQLVAYQQQKANLETQLTHWQGLETQYYNEYNCQLYGGPTCPKKGAGPVYAAAHKNYEQAVNEVTTLQGQINQVQTEITQRDSLLNSNSKVDQQNRYTEALAQKPLVQNEYNTAVERQNQLQATYFAQEQASHGILMKLEALSQLSNGNTTVAAARFLLFLLFLVIECLPVTVKLLQKPGIYEEALREAREAERRDAKKFYSGRSRLASGGFPPGGDQRDTPGHGPFVLRLQAEPSLDPIWNPTRALPTAVDDPADDEPTEAYERDSDPGSIHGGRVEYGPEPRAQQHWHGDERWRNNWPAQADEDEPHEERGRAERGSVDQTRVDEPQPYAAQTRLDYRYPDDVRLDDIYQPGDRGEQGPAYHAGDWQDRDRRGAMDDEEPVSARSEGNGSGTPLSWDDE